MIKKLTQNKALERKYIKRAKWNLSQDDLQFANQLKAINEMFFDNLCDNKIYNNEMTKIITQQINQKITGYKNQDVIKNMFDAYNFIVFTDIVTKMNTCELKCYYCNRDLVIVYNKKKESIQWTLERLNNNIGHYKENTCISCLKCNLGRRTENYEYYKKGKTMILQKLI
jgi:NAD-dependent dihydropyrimidine dehydrogenase PreA subunit